MYMWVSSYDDIYRLNGPFLSCLHPLFQSDTNGKAVDMKMICYSHTNETIFTRKVLHLASFWKWVFGTRKWPIGKTELSWNFLLRKTCHVFRSDYNIAIGHAFGFFLQKIAVMEMIIRTVKQLFKVHMQSGEWHKAYFLGHYLQSATKLVETRTVYFALKGLS